MIVPDQFSVEAEIVVLRNKTVLLGSVRWDARE
jgi:hypothetical protein